MNEGACKEASVFLSKEYRETRYMAGHCYAHLLYPSDGIDEEEHEEANTREHDGCQQRCFEVVWLLHELAVSRRHVPCAHTNINFIHMLGVRLM
jgi:hypothetical protein